MDAQDESQVMEIAGGPAFTAVTLTGMTLKNGAARFSPNFQGGGIRVVNAELTLDHVNLSHNRADLNAGGILVDTDAKVVILNSAISGNSAAGDGGGIMTNGSSSLTLLNSTVSANTVPGDGGGLFIAGGDVTVRAATFSGNVASKGGGIANGNGGGTPTPAGGLLAIRSSTFTRNVGTLFGGGLVHGGSGGGRTTVANSIVAGNTGGDCASPSGGSSSLGHNIGGCTALFTSGGDRLVLPSQVFTEVLEQDLADNGGPTETHALLARGRAVDAGYCPGETADQRGFTRPVDDPAVTNAVEACDIGAYELQGPVAAVADLMISQSVNKTSVKQGDLLTYSVRVRNLGPETAPGVVVTDLLPTGATFVSARYNKGSHTAPPAGETGTVTWSVGDLVDQADEVAEITVTVLVRGKTTITNTASVTGAVADPNQANNSAAIKVSVASGSGAKTGGKK